MPDPQSFRDYTQYLPSMTTSTWMPAEYVSPTEAMLIYFGKLPTLEERAAAREREYQERVRLFIEGKTGRRGPPLFVTDPESPPGTQRPKMRVLCLACQQHRHDLCGRQVKASGIQCECGVCWGDTPQENPLDKE